MDFLKKTYNSYCCLNRQLYSAYPCVIERHGRALVGGVYITYHNLFSNVGVSTHKGGYSVTYFLHGHMYIINFKLDPCPVDLPIILDEQDNDITLELEPLMGPNLDFHSQYYTPETFGKKSLTVIKDGETKKINASNKIIL